MAEEEQLLPVTVNTSDQTGSTTTGTTVDTTTAQTQETTVDDAPTQPARVYSHYLQQWFEGATQEEAETKRANSENWRNAVKGGEATRGSQDLVVNAYSDPSSAATNPDVHWMHVQDGQILDHTLAGLGADPSATQQVAQTSTAAGVTGSTVPKVTAYTSTNAVQAILDKVQAAEGNVSADAIVKAFQGDPETLAQLGLDAAQLDQAQQIDAPAPRTLQDGELNSGSAVDFAKIQEEFDVQAAQAQPSKQATVAGQLETLMADFEGGETPAWAAGAMRSAMATLQSRGLGASSLAGQAVVQAAMESAIPIATADAQTYSTFEQQNLSNRQAAAMVSAQYRASFLNLDFTQEFQARVANAAAISDIANINFTAEQQIALENAQLAQTVDLQNLTNRQALVMADAAAMSQMDLANLSAQQQAAVQNAQNFLQMDLQNLSNQQQMATFTQQALAQQLLSDTAAENTARQINATNVLQAQQFTKELNSQVNQFNAAQQNAMAQYNAGEATALSKFNSELANQRDQFEATMGLEIAQSNVAWRRDVATTNSTTQNAANMEYAQTANAITQQSLDALWQRERDIMAFAFEASESTEDRNLQILLADKEIDAEQDAARSEGIGRLVGGLLFGSSIF